MDNYSDWFADGTFKTSPLIFSQVYTIHVLIKENIIIPTIYALLPNKTEETYIRKKRSTKIRLNGFKNWSMGTTKMIN